MILVFKYFIQNFGTIQGSPLNISRNDDDKLMTCFCGKGDWQKALSIISSRHHCQRFSPSQISVTPQAGYKPVHYLRV